LPFTKAKISILYDPVKKRKVIVYDMEDFICRCGSTDLETIEDSEPATVRCNSCGRYYRIEKKEKSMRISNLPMSFGFRSLYWNEIEVEKKGLSGKLEEFYEITEIEKPEDKQ